MNSRNLSTESSSSSGSSTESRELIKEDEEYIQLQIEELQKKKQKLEEKSGEKLIEGMTLRQLTRLVTKIVQKELANKAEEDGPQMKCSYCHLTNHTIRDCRKLQRAKKFTRTLVRRNF